MSVVFCGACANLIDSDDDPECFTRNGDGPVRCEPCRETDSADDYACDMADAQNDEEWLEAHP